MLKRSLSPLLVFVFICSLSLTPASAEEKPDAPPKIARVNCRVRVVNANGEPLQGAEVTPSGFRTVVERGSHWGWATNRFGEKPTVETNDQGIAEISVPKFVIEQMAIGEVTWLVDHSGYVIYRADHKIGEDPAEITLKSGYRVAATAVDAETGEPIKTDLHAIMGGIQMSLNPQWRLSKGGMLISRVFDDAQITIRLVELKEGKPARFSDLTTVKRDEESSRVFVRDIKLKPGTRVQGRLDDSVPRPVTAGRVIATVIASTSVDVQDYSQTCIWSESADINPDGSFEFASLPQGEIAQLIAICDGYVSRSPTVEEIAAVVPWEHRNQSPGIVNPQVFPLDAPTITPVVKMEATTDVEVTVLDPQGNPLPGAHAAMWPNHHLLRLGNTLLGNCVPTADFLTGKFKKLSMESITKSNRFQGETNEKGVVVIRSLPRLENVGLGIEHPEFLQPIENNNRSTYVKLNNKDKTTAVTIQMEAKDDAE